MIRIAPFEKGAAIDAVVAHAYGLTRDQYAHVLSTFSHSSYKHAPRQCLAAFDELQSLGLDGFRGGAGRTLALAHVATMLAQRGLMVAAVDFDLEAPGLHVALGADPPIDGKGLVSLLQKTLTTEPEDSVNVMEHVQVISPKAGTGKILLLPAGRITRNYLAQIEELGIGLWHEPKHSPLERILASLKTENPDVIFIDCRTGFSGMSASVLFHLADLAVIFLPLTEQVWDGVAVLLQAVAAARTFRDERPGSLFVPCMVPSGEPGQEKVKRYLNKLSELYAKWLPRGQVEQEEEEAEILEDEPWLREGIIWDSRISSDGSVRQPFILPGPWAHFLPLCDNIVAALGLGLPQQALEPVQARAILSELQISGSIGFAEDLNEEEMQRIMVPSESVKASVDRSSALIVGAKGSGKTLLWRYLVEKKRDDVVRLPSDTQYVVGHAPKFDSDPQKINLSADAFKELEQAARMRKTSTYKAFWLLYGLFRLSRAREDIAGWLDVNMPSALRASWRRLVATSRTPDFTPILKVNSVSTLTEDVFAALDDWLAARPQQYVLVFDGLDNGFQTGKPAVWYQRREHFVTGLLQVVADWRSRLRRIQFKVFLREDIYLSIELQNQSHLDAAKHELRFGPIDLWQLALNSAMPYGIGTLSQKRRSEKMNNG